ncbi:hypothetical protein L1049_009872 [Liquidambar formosana]|uniref:F-box domain-containing protein n=1 Tax=Liquidambar formosana TaxID=63359 RepID=A0AAP0N827_LIQFO
MAESTNENLEMVQDMISILPDEILQLILEKLPLEDAVKTGCLSRRWKDVWKYITRISFESSWVESTGKEIVPSLDHFVSLHQGPKVKCFSFEMTYELNMADQVNSWILFAVKKNVERLCLDFDVDRVNYELNTEHDPCYELHSRVFTCESLVSLTLRFCRLKFPDLFHLRYLRTIKLWQIELPDKTLQKVTSNTPVLEELVLIECSRTFDFYIDVAPNPNFHTLEIVEELSEVHSWTVIEINAPSVRKLVMCQCMPRLEYRIKNISQCHEVRLNFDSMFGAVQVEENGGFRDYEDILLKLLSNFKHARTLRLCNWCIQLLSVREVRKFTGSLSFSCTHLDLYTCFQMWETPGIAYILKACHDVENLVILIDEYDGHAVLQIYDVLTLYDFEEISKFWRNEDYSLVGHLKNLKVVEFKETREEYHIMNNGTFELHTFFKERELGMHLVDLLMENADNLKCVVFSSDKQQHVIYRKDVDVVDKV